MWISKLPIKENTMAYPKKDDPKKKPKPGEKPKPGDKKGKKPFPPKKK
jgi:hypothetical protein